MSPNFSTTARNYLKSFQRSVRDARASGAVSVEMATRPVVHQFIENLVRLTEPNPGQAIVHHDTTVTPGNRPDWRIEDFTTFGVFAYGDHKNLSDGTQFNLSSGERAQMERYLGLGRPVFVFDGIEFIFLDPTQADPFAALKRLSLVPKPLTLTADWSTLPIEPLVETTFAQLIARPGFRKWSEGDLVEQLANRARLLADEVAGLLDAPRGSGASKAEDELLHALHDLQDQLAEHHDPSLRGVRSCSEFVAQVLIFGMFYAHTQAPAHGSTPDQRREVIRTFWTEETFVNVAQRLRPFHSIAQVLADSLADTNGLSTWYRDAAAVLAHAEYVGTASGPTDYHLLFERFLASFSPSTRFDYGAWYTPPALTNWMIRFADELSQRSFGTGLAASTAKVIDPCVGTGGYLEAYVNFVGTGECDTTLIGFEVLPTPYALAQYRLTKAVSGTSFEPRLHLLLTDTLSDQIENPPSPSMHEFDKEVAEASMLATPPLRLVIGNPPSSIHASSGAPRRLIEGKLDDFRPPEHLRSDRQNIQKALNNEAYRFLRWCSDRVLSTDRGILALVVPGSFVHAVSLRYARTWMKNKFDQLWVLELDEDARNGAGTESLFNVLQGRAVIFGVNGGASSEVRHLSIASETLKEKTAFLDAPVNLRGFQTIDGESDQLAPRSPYPVTAWKASWPLLGSNIEEGIFKLKCSGVKLGLTALFHVDSPQLVRRSKALALLPLKPLNEIRRLWFEGQQKPPRDTKLTPQVRAALGAAVGGKNPKILGYSFRPFVRGYAVVDDNVFKQLVGLDGGGTRARPEIRAAFDQGAAAILVAPGPRDLGASLTRFVSFAWNLPDNDNASRGNSMVYCDRYPTSPPGRDAWDPTAAPNTSSTLRLLFNDQSDPDRAIIYYCYAVMSCEAYLEAFEPVLYVSSDPDRPFRVPVAADRHIRKRLISLGQQLAKCEDFDATVPAANSLAVDWPADVAEFSLIGYEINDRDGEVELRGSSGERAVLSGVSPAVCTHRIAGHHVLEKWLRERKYPYLRRTFRAQDLDDLLDVISRLERQLELLQSINELMLPLLDNPDLLAPPVPPE